MLKSLRSNTATGPDNIPARILIECANELAPSLSIIFNLSLLTGMVPDDWKLSNVIPVFKSGTRNDCKNYRPISITSIISKVLEKIISSEILLHLTLTGQIPVNQHGFLPRRSCNTLHMKTIND